MEQLTEIFSPPNRNETAMAAPSPRVLETDTSAPRVDKKTAINLQGWLKQKQQQQQQ
jgi:hypothetical protein